MPNDLAKAEVQQPIAELRGISKYFGSVVAAENLNLTIRRGEFLSFLGPSGCGKTTALRMLAGFDAPTRGDVLLDGEKVNDLSAHRRPVNMVFQNYALFPHLNVQDNIAYGLRQQRPKRASGEIAALVEKALETVRLPGFGRRRIWEMSGGQQQRVALARALINQPKLLLLDEPMAALDRKLRRDMQIELQTLQRQLGITFILVTHDQEEALSMSDRICVMRAGRIVQVGSPRELYDRPMNRYVADFVGKTNFFDGILSTVSGSTGTIAAKGAWQLSGQIIGTPLPGQRVSINLRPEQISLRRLADDAQDVSLPVLVVNRIFLGEHTEYLVKNDDLGEFIVLVPRQAEAAEGGFAPGDSGFATWLATSALVLANE
ncbi:MAG: ABC transporter ATP-binding protein [Pseudorhodobacter sp.]|nr:ABC transporter ATP-binding protein [Pseudorhodobacter sp.]